MEIQTRLRFLSGTGREDMMAVAIRYEAARGPESGRCESWVLEFTAGNKIRPALTRPGLVTGLWRSETGRGFATAKAGVIYAFRVESPGVGWRSWDVEWTPLGVWGLDDRNVWVWGEQYGTGVLRRWTGARTSGSWKEVPSTVERLQCMHGVRADRLFAVGEGAVLSWDGERWRHERLPGAGALSSIFVAGEDEAYACGESGELWVRAGEEWSLRLRRDGALRSVAKWRGRVWVGADDGLFELVGEELVPRKPNLPAIGLDARKALVICTENLLATTEDAERYRGFTTEKLAVLASAGPLSDEIRG